uniref:Putative secreted protein n=1 Tax=Anopheles triannulatus TaxID=58253 RepID=A0A2M4B3T2_9DIPT
MLCLLLLLLLLLGHPLAVIKPRVVPAHVPGHQHGGKILGLHVICVLQHRGHGRRRRDHVRGRATRYTAAHPVSTDSTSPRCASMPHLWPAEVWSEVQFDFAGLLREPLLLVVTAIQLGIGGGCFRFGRFRSLLSTRFTTPRGYQFFQQYRLFVVVAHVPYQAIAVRTEADYFGLIIDPVVVRGPYVISDFERFRASTIHQLLLRYLHGAPFVLTRRDRTATAATTTTAIYHRFVGFLFRGFPTAGRGQRGLVNHFPVRLHR